MVKHMKVAVSVAAQLSIVPVLFVSEFLHTEVYYERIPKHTYSVHQNYFCLITFLFSHIYQQTFEMHEKEMKDIE